jgi:hypothetical protein
MRVQGLRLGVVDPPRRDVGKQQGECVGPDRRGSEELVGGVRCRRGPHDVQQGLGIDAVARHRNLSA